VKPGKQPFSTKLGADKKPQFVANPHGSGKMLIPTPMLVAEEMRKIRKGQIKSPTAIREALALKHGAQVTCPMTTGIFINIVAGAAEEDLAAKRKPVAPYWRVVPDNGRLSSKLPYGDERQAKHLRAEGHTVTRDKKGWVVS
jgi:hypothetical protein